MKKVVLAATLMAIATLAQAANEAITVYQDPNCGCCSGWVKHMRVSGFTVKAIKTDNMVAIKTKLGTASSSRRTLMEKHFPEISQKIRYLGYVTANDVF